MIWIMLGAVAIAALILLCAVMLIVLVDKRSKRCTNCRGKGYHAGFYGRAKWCFTCRGTGQRFRP